MSGNTIAAQRDLTCAPSRAARELGLRRGEFDLAVHLGRIRTVPDEGVGGGRRVARAEIDRLRGQDGFPESIRESVRAVGTTEGAALMDVPAARFTRLARLGLVVPVKFYLNRYRAVVWLYLAEELRKFAADERNARLLTGRTPQPLRDRLGEGQDLRARTWRGRHLGFLLRQARDPWERAGAVAAFLDPAHVTDMVADPYERAQVNRFRPGPPAHCAPGSPSAELIEWIMTADDPDEVGRLRSELAQALAEARAHRPAPRPVTCQALPARHLAPSVSPTGPSAPHSPPPPAAPDAACAPKPSRGPRGWLRRRSRLPTGH
ncbi:DUF6397 family protein [Streptomyces sp. NPDC004542]|uniref:DUF6397 family protein n=1 Tax=Streptomyces sp. NPDC004542 TaxID=3154281 RepID=UPI0033B1F6F3